MLRAIKQFFPFRYTYWWFLLANYKRKICNNALTPSQKEALKDYKLGYALYNRTDSSLVKSRKEVHKDLNRLMKYWHCYPDIYFRMGMFLKGYTDWKQMISFLPQLAFTGYEERWSHYLEYAFLLENKIIFNDFCVSNGIPVPVVLFSYRNGRFFAKGGLEISDNEVNRVLSSSSANRIFAKLATGGCGKGISVFTKRNDDYFTSKWDGIVDARSIRMFCGNEDYHFEEGLSQDQVLSQFCPDTINTLRVVTMNNSGDECIFVGAAVRFGRMGGYVDNLAQGGVSVNLDVTTGELFEYGMREYDLTKYYEHPDTKLKFAHLVIPQWQKIKELIVHVSSLLPSFKEIGWDIALTLNGPVIVELNTGTGIYSVQMGPKYGVAKYFKDCIPTYSK